jgi:hypothetical protein
MYSMNTLLSLIFILYIIVDVIDCVFMSWIYSTIVITMKYILCSSNSLDEILFAIWHSKCVMCFEEWIISIQLQDIFLVSQLANPLGGLDTLSHFFLQKDKDW